MRSALASILCAIALAGCGLSQEAAAPGPARPAGPLTYEAATAAAKVSLALPERVGQIPALHARLYGEETAALDAFAKVAANDLEKLRAAGLPARPYTRTVQYTVAGETPRLIGLRVLRFEDTGGAHPNTALAGLVWDKAAGKALETTDLLATGANTATADKALCDAIKAEKRRRIGDDSFNAIFTGCPRLTDTRTTLVPSTVKDKAGGLTALFSPYDLGPYVEGAYEIETPASALQGALNPAYAAEFAGEPAPARPPPAPGT